MPDYTTNYNLKKPLGNENFSRNDQNGNVDIIDTQMKQNADDAAAKIPKSLATAANQFLVSSGVGAWVVKTIAEIKTLLGLGSAAYTDVTAYATAAQGTTADDTAAALTSHEADYAYQVAGGTATAITLTINNLADGYPMTFIASANNSGAATTINSKHLYKPNTTTAPTLVSGKAYTVWYDAGDDCFFIKASAEGTASVGDVLATKTFSNDNDTGLVGIMTDRGVAEFDPANTDVSIPSGYYAAGSKVNAITIEPGEVLLQSADALSSGSQTSWTKAKDIEIDSAGTVRVRFDLYSGSGSNIARGQIYINGSPVGIERTTYSTTNVTFTEDIAVQAGDNIQVYRKSDVSNFSRVMNFRLYTSLKFVQAEVITD